MIQNIVKIEDICTTTQGVQITKTHTSGELYEGGYRYLYIADFLSDKNLSFVNDDFDAKKVTENDLVMANTGSPGRVFKGKDGILSNNLFKITFKKKEVDRDYLFLMLSSTTFQYSLQKQMKGGIQKHLGHKTIARQKIPLPPLAEQQKIAAILNAADSLRQKDQQLIEHYTALSQSLFLEMFGDPVSNPMGWEQTTLDDVCDKIYGGGTPSKAVPEYYIGDIPWVTPKDMKSEYIGNSLVHINKEAIDNSSAKLIPTEAVLMVIRSGILKHTLPVAINTRNVTVNQDMKAFIPNNNKTNPWYLLHFFKGVENYLLGKVRAVTADNIEFRQIKELPFPAPQSPYKTNSPKQSKP